MLYKHCGPKYGEMIELNPKNDPYLKNIIDYVNKNEKYKKRFEELHFVPNSRNLVSWVLLKFFKAVFSTLITFYSIRQKMQVKWPLSFIH
jgi:hypothetical protein